MSSLTKNYFKPFSGIKSLRRSITVFLIILILGYCDPKNNGGVLIPSQGGNYIWIYKPEGDFFPGPSTTELKAGEWYDEWVPNDHTFVKDVNGKWHIIGITHPKTSTLSIHEGEFLSFHTISQSDSFKETMEKWHYTDLPKILPPKERPVERLENHAPYIIKKDRLYYMIYGPSPFRLAISEDLTNWELRGNLFSEDGGARDPNLLLFDGIYYLVYCTTRNVRIRTSEDLVKWSEPKTIFTSQSFDPESPSLVYHNQTFYLFFSSWDGIWDKKEIIGAYQHLTHVHQSDDPFNFGDESTRLTTLKSHAPEIFQGEDGQWYISSVEWPHRGVSVDLLEWN